MALMQAVLPFLPRRRGGLGWVHACFTFPFNTDLLLTPSQTLRKVAIYIPGFIKRRGFPQDVGISLIMDIKPDAGVTRYILIGREGLKRLS